MEHAKLVVLQSYGSRPEAELAKSVLESSGIPVMIQADTAGGMREHLAWSGLGFRILVREEDVTRARETLTQTAEGSAADEPDRDPPPTWRQFT